MDALTMDGWEMLAACRFDPDPDAWFAGPHERDRQQHAIRVCLGCPVRVECLEVALERGFPGVWAATSERQRRKMRRAAA